MIIMKETFKNGFKTFDILWDKTDYTRGEEIMHWLCLPFVFAIYVALFLLISVMYFIERLFAFTFIFFMSLQSKSLQRRTLSEPAFKKLYTLLSLFMFIVFFPFITVYYLAMIIKFIGKQLLKKLLLWWDFANKIDPISFYIFDDVNIHSKMKMTGMMKDLSNTKAIGSAFEDIVNQMHADDDKKS